MIFPNFAFKMEKKQYIKPTTETISILSDEFCLIIPVSNISEDEEAAKGYTYTELWDEIGYEIDDNNNDSKDLWNDDDL
jgi:hypothetical protein